MALLARKYEEVVLKEELSEAEGGGAGTTNHALDSYNRKILWMWRRIQFQHLISLQAITPTHTHPIALKE